MKTMPQTLLISCLFSCLYLPSYGLAQTATEQAPSSNPPHQFIVQDGSKHYNALITVEQCDQNTCQGNGSVQLTHKNGDPIQNFTSDDLYFFLSEQQQPTVNVIQLYDEQSPLIFDDFNFDGTEDLAIRNGNQSGYGGPSYDVYVFNRSRGQFILSKELTELAYNNLGMFQTDPVRQRLTTFTKSGCCWHESTEYAVVPKRGLVATRIITEDATSADGRYVYVTTQTRTNGVNGKLVRKTQKYKITDYYQQ